MKMGKTLAMTAASGILVGLLAGCGGGDAASSGSTTPSGAGSAAPADSSGGGAKTSCSGAAGGNKTSCSGAAGASSAAPAK